jgi:hypothetical protein
MPRYVAALATQVSARINRTTGDHDERPANWLKKDPDPHCYWIYKRLTLPDPRWQAANAQYMLALQLNRLSLNRTPRVVFYRLLQY